MIITVNSEYNQGLIPIFLQKYSKFGTEKEENVPFLYEN